MVTPFEPAPRRRRGPAPRRDRLLTVILLWTTLLTGILFWLPLVRSLAEGSEYQWGLAPGVGGRGTGGAFGLLVLGALFAFALLYLGRRGARPPFHWLLLALHLPLTVAVVRMALAQPDAFKFEGSSLGIEISLTWLGPIVFGFFSILCVVWVARDLIRRERRRLAPWRWTRGARLRLAVVILLIPIEVHLLRGPLGSPREIAGVLLTVTQWFFLNRALNARSVAAHLQGDERP